MKREEKVKRKIERAKKRRDNRNKKYKEKISKVSECGSNVPLWVLTNDGMFDCWPDSSSSTGYFQKCSYEAWGICEAPCNGDC